MQIAHHPAEIGANVPASRQTFQCPTQTEAASLLATNLHDRCCLLHLIGTGRRAACTPANPGTDTTSTHPGPAQLPLAPGCSWLAAAFAGELCVWLCWSFAMSRSRAAGLLVCLCSPASTAWTRAASAALCHLQQQRPENPRSLRACHRPALADWLACWIVILQVMLTVKCLTFRSQTNVGRM